MPRAASPRWAATHHFDWSIDVYRPARLDPAVPIEDTIGAIADMVKAGYVRHIGLVTAYGVLSRGLLAGSKPSGPRDMRAHLPRFADANARKNQALVDALVRLAQQRGVTPTQLAIAWVRAKGAALGVTVIPTMGARTRTQLEEALAALELALTPTDLAELEAAVPAEEIAGTRYPEPLMALLDSER